MQGKLILQNFRKQEINIQLKVNEMCLIKEALMMGIIEDIEQDLIMKIDPIIQDLFTTTHG